MSIIGNGLQDVNFRLISCFMCQPSYFNTVIMEKIYITVAYLKDMCGSQRRARERERERENQRLSQWK